MKSRGTATSATAFAAPPADPTMAGEPNLSDASGVAADSTMQEISDVIFARIAARLKAMASPARLKILHALQRGELAVHEVLAQVGGSQANVSKHLNVLRAAGLVTSRRDGMSVSYAISDAAVFAICRTVCDSLLNRATAEVEVIEEARALMLAGRD
jgi:DNA-binding transcriptional ArsR family regulator